MGEAGATMRPSTVVTPSVDDDQAWGEADPVADGELGHDRAEGESGPVGRVPQPAAPLVLRASQQAAVVGPVVTEVGPPHLHIDRLAGFHAVPFEVSPEPGRAGYSIATWGGARR